MFYLKFGKIFYFIAGVITFFNFVTLILFKVFNNITFLLPIQELMDLNPFIYTVSLVGSILLCFISFVLFVRFTKSIVEKQELKEKKAG